MNKQAYFQKIISSNRRFRQLSAAQKRVRIAKDVIDQLEMRFLKATPGAYLEADIPVRLDNGDEQLNKILPTVPQCEVCGIGSMFVCAVLRADNLTVRENHNMYDRYISFNRSYLAKFFSISQLELIEQAFEQWENHGHDVSLLPNHPRTRLVYIMRNIVRNKGKYKPPTKKVRVRKRGQR